jgi:hypothetical protein
VDAPASRKSIAAVPAWMRPGSDLRLEDGLEDLAAELPRYSSPGSPYATSLVGVALVIGVLLMVLEPLRIGEAVTSSLLAPTVSVRPTDQATHVYVVADAMAAEAVASWIEEADRVRLRNGFPPLSYRLIIASGDLRTNAAYQQIVEVNLYRRASGLPEFLIFDMRGNQVQH